MGKTATPDKSFIAVIETSKSTRIRMEYINRKGKFEYSPTCTTCQHKGEVQDGIGGFPRLGHLLSPTCDRDGKTWRHRTIEYSEPRTCKFYKVKEAS